MPPLVYDCVPFLNVPFITSKAVEGVQIGQPVKPFCFAKQLHWPSAFCATQRLRLLVYLPSMTRSPTKPVVSERCGAWALPPRGRKLNFWQEFAGSKTGRVSGNDPTLIDAVQAIA